MPRTPCSFNKRRPRTFISAIALAALSLFFSAGLCAAQTQRGANNSNSNTQAKRTTGTKRVSIGRGSVSRAGSRQTIKSDNPLNDYSAYRSGDRFNVVIPNADANSIAKGAGGRGYTDMQVEQRGADVVISYRLQPGAKPRVEQQFNRLDVVFDTSGGAAQPPANKSATPATDSAARASRAPNSPQTETTTRATQAASPSNAESAKITTASNGARDATPSQPATEQQAAPASTEPVELASANAPASRTTVPAATEQIGATLGAGLLSNWPVVLIIALLVIGLGLYFVARRASAAQPAPGAVADEKSVSQSKLNETAATPALKEAPAITPLGAHGATPVSEPDVTAPVVAASALTGAVAAKESVGGKNKKKGGKKKKGQRKTGPLSVEARPRAESPTAELAEAHLSHAEASPSTIEAAPSDAPPSVENESGVVADTESVQAETKRLLDGEDYDRRVLEAAGMMGRQIVAAELLSALSGRNAERRERARAAFVEHGFLKEAARDLHEAEAPAERAAAARSLALSGDRAATTHLVAALEDKAIEVRRASVEALAELRDPAAVSPLEELRERQQTQRDKLPLRMLQHAIEACREGVEVEQGAAPAAHPDDGAVVVVEPQEAEPVIEDAAAWFSVVSEANAVAEPPAEETVMTGANVVESESQAPVETRTEAAQASKTPTADAEMLDGNAATDWVEIDVAESFSGPVARGGGLSATADAAPDNPATAESSTSTFEGDRLASPITEVAAEAPLAEASAGTAAAAAAPSDVSRRATAIADISRLDSDEAFEQLCAAFDDEAREVHNAAARALYDLRADRADSFTRALRAATPERRRRIGAAINASGLAEESIGQLIGDSREQTYEAFSLLFLMAKAGEAQPLLRAIEAHPNNEVRLAVVKLLALSGQKQILPSFRRLAVRGSLPTEVRAAIMEAIYQISSSQDAAPTA